MNYVYSIEIEGVTRYIGITDNPKRRQNQHTRALNGGHDKYLYNQIRLNAPETTPVLQIIKEFSDRGDAKRWEAYLILGDYFGERNLWQSFPVSIKYF